MVAHSSDTQGCFRPHCFPEIDGAVATPDPKAGEAFPADGGRGGVGPFIPANHGAEAGENPERSLEDQLALARQEGHAAGFEAGQKAAAESLAPVIQALQSAVAAMTATESDLTAQAERAVVELSLAIAAKVIPRAIGELPDAVLTVVNQALGKVLAGTRLTLRVNPADLERLQASQEALALPAIDPARLTWSADPGVGPGGCILETDFGDVDARIEHQLQLIEKLFRHQLARTDATEEGQGTDG
jgi:flagellar assembly protein FliH